ncbi:nodulin-26-like [Prosopis cineraria]|uniref:nodulin-26-like n=1 Tax=Prosopis cineraria TaxID=364024 RepID=UPI00240FA949|nr:nodulin-26-like [Prosopis cineraria]
MADGASGSNGTCHYAVLNVEDKQHNNEGSCISVSAPFSRKLVAESAGTFFLMFGGEASEVLDEGYGNKLSLPGIAVVWGLAVPVLVCAVRHIYGADFNPAVTLAFAATGRFPLNRYYQLVLIRWWHPYCEWDTETRFHRKPWPLGRSTTLWDASSRFCG